jgi:hypothetical protein
MPHAAHPKITVAVCTRSGGTLLTELLTSLTNQTLPQESIEILLFDLASDTEERRQFWSDFDLPWNAGIIAAPETTFSVLRQLAAEASHAPTVSFLEENAIALPGWCEAIIDCFSNQPDVAVIGGPIEPIWPAGVPAWYDPSLRELYGLSDYGVHSRRLISGELLPAWNIVYAKQVLLKGGIFDHGLKNSASMDKLEQLLFSLCMSFGSRSFYSAEAKLLRRIPEDETSQQWARRNACWRTIATALWHDAKNEPSAWASVASYLERVPREMRGLRALFLDSSDSELFQRQRNALDGFVKLAFFDGSDPEK